MQDYQLVHRCVDPNLQSETTGQFKNQAAIVSAMCLFYPETEQEAQRASVRAEIVNFGNLSAWIDDSHVAAFYFDPNIWFRGEILIQEIMQLEHADTNHRYVSTDNGAEIDVFW